jgi:hypothetical protein
MATRSSCDRPRRANENIPSPRHRLLRADAPLVGDRFSGAGSCAEVLGP